MLHIKSEGDYIKIEIELKKYCHTLFFWQKEENELFRNMKLHEIKSSLFEQIESIRREAYKKGWSDKASKKVKKADWFTGNINRTDCP